MKTELLASEEMSTVLTLAVYNEYQKINYLLICDI